MPFTLTPPGTAPLIQLSKPRPSMTPETIVPAGGGVRHAQIHSHCLKEPIPMQNFRIIAAALAMTAPAAAQTLFDGVLKRLAASKGGVLAPVALAPIAVAQSATIDRLLAVPLTDHRIAADRAEAAPLIRRLLAAGACARAPEAWNAFNRDHLSPRSFTSSDSVDGDLVAMKRLRYHDKNGCLDVERLTDWKKPAANALNLKVFYVAADSGEAKDQTFELQKVEGRWMIREIGASY